jgi:hypothetical protein
VTGIPGFECQQPHASHAITPQQELLRRRPRKETLKNAIADDFLKKRENKKARYRPTSVSASGYLPAAWQLYTAFALQLPWSSLKPHPGRAADR